MATVDVAEVRKACDDVVAGFTALATTLRPEGTFQETAQALMDLGPLLHTFGVVYGAYFNQGMED